MVILKTLSHRHCEGVSPKQSIVWQHSGLLPASYLAVAMTEKQSF